MEVGGNEIKDEKLLEDEDEANWQEKYELAEKQLKRVRQQTAKVRELLNIKVTKNFLCMCTHRSFV